MKKYLKHKEDKACAMLAKRIERFQVLGLASLRSASPRVRFYVYRKQNVLSSPDGNGILLYIPKGL